MIPDTVNRSLSSSRRVAAVFTTRKVTVKGPTVENDRGDINKTYTVKVNMSYEDWRDADVDLLYWYMQRLCKEYNPCEEDTYLIFNYDVRGESGGYVFGYPDGGTIASVD